MCQYKRWMWNPRMPIGHEIIGAFCMKYSRPMSKENQCNGNYEECCIANGDEK